MSALTEGNAFCLIHTKSKMFGSAMKWKTLSQTGHSEKDDESLGPLQRP